MTIKTLPATFADQTLDIVIIGNERWAMGPQIGAALGYPFDPSKAIRKIYQRNHTEFDTSDTMVVEIPDRLGRMQLTRLFSHKGVAKLAMLAQTPRAAQFRDWAAQQLTSPPVPPPAPPLLPSRRPPSPPISRISRARIMTALRTRYPMLGPIRRWFHMGLTDQEVQVLTRDSYSRRQVRELRALLTELGELPSLAQRRYDVHSPMLERHHAAS